MRYVAAYLLAVLGGNTNPSSKDIKNILGSVGIEADDERLNKVDPGSNKPVLNRILEIIIIIQLKCFIIKYLNIHHNINFFILHSLVYSFTRSKKIKRISIQSCVVAHWTLVHFPSSYSITRMLMDSN